MLKLIVVVALSPCIAACNQRAEVSSSDLVAQPVAARTIEPPAEGTAENFGEVYDRWKETTARQREVVRTLRDGSATDARALREELSELNVVTLQQVFPQLAQASVRAFKEGDDDTKKKAEAALMEVAEIAFSLDRYSTALEVAELLISGEKTDKSMYDIAGSAAFATDDFQKAKDYFTIAREKGALRRGQKFASEVDKYLKMWEVEKELRAAEKMTDDLPRVEMKTSAGDMVIELYENEAPGAVGNFVSLVEDGFYDGLVFHRVIPGFMAQGGDPTGTGSGGPGYQIFCECSKPEARMHFAGSLSMAHAGRDTGGSQFFMTFLPTPHLNEKHTVFGRVIEGLDVLEKIKRVDPHQGGERDRITKATVIRKRMHEYKPIKTR